LKDIRRLSGCVELREINSISHYGYVQPLCRKKS
jgi:hypothetical protein